VKRILSPVEKSIHKNLVNMMLQSLSGALGATEKLITSRGEANIGIIVNNLNAVTLSLRFQKDFVYPDNSKDDSVLSS
jgi:hypothetical protein